MMAMPLPSRASPSPRERIEAMIEQLLAMLDELDGDADSEPDADFEPSIGDGYGVADLELDDCDAEPGLGWPETDGEHDTSAGAWCLDLEDDVCSVTG